MLVHFTIKGNVLINILFWFQCHFRVKVLLPVQLALFSMD